MSGAVQVQPTGIAGLLAVSLPVHHDARGWFKENWQRAQMTAAGLPDFRPVQNNVSFNAVAGTTRGFHAEPWDKYVSVAAGRVFAAWVDLREGPGFGAVHWQVLDPSQAVFVPRGVANAFQALEHGTVYSYLVTRHWSQQATASYSYVNLADAQLAVPWPLGLDPALVSAADRAHPPLAHALPVAPGRIVVLGAGGQLGQEFARRARQQPQLVVLDRAALDLSSRESIEQLDLQGVDQVINAAAMTDVDRAESPAGRREAWQANAAGPAWLAERCAQAQVRLLQVSTDYVYDGRDPEASEHSPVAPLGAYGQSKAAGDLAVLAAGPNIVLRTSWLLGRGRNFASTMHALAVQGRPVQVVDDQFGRPTSTRLLADGLLHLVQLPQAAGVYHLQGSGASMSWYHVARLVYELAGAPAALVQPVSARQHASRHPQAAPRPAFSVLGMQRLEQTGFQPVQGLQLLREGAGLPGSF